MSSELAWFGIRSLIKGFAGKNGGEWLQLKDLKKHVSERTLDIFNDKDLRIQFGKNGRKIVQEEFYYKQWSEGQIQQTGTTVTIASGRLPHGIHEGGQLRYANGLHTKITSMGSFGSKTCSFGIDDYCRLLSPPPPTQPTHHLRYW